MIDMIRRTLPLGFMYMKVDFLENMPWRARGARTTNIWALEKNSLDLHIDASLVRVYLLHY